MTPQAISALTRALSVQTYKSTVCTPALEGFIHRNLSPRGIYSQKPLSTLLATNVQNPTIYQDTDSSSALPLYPLPSVALYRLRPRRADIPSMTTSSIATGVPDPMGHVVDYSRGTEDNDIPKGGDEEGGLVPAPLQPQASDSLPGFAPPLPDISAVYADAIKAADWAEMSSTLRASMTANAPNTIRKVHALDSSL